MTHILWKLYHFQRVIEESGAEMQKHQEELKEHRRSIKKYEDTLKESQKEQSRVSREVSMVERGIKKKEKEIETKENGLGPIAEKIDITSKNLKTCRARIAEISKERDTHSASVKQSTKDLKVVEKAQAQWENDWKKLAEQEGRDLSEADIQQYNRLKEDVTRRTSADQIKVDNLARQQRADEETVNSLKSKVDSIEWHIRKLEDELNEMSQRKKSTEDQIGQVSKDINAKKKAFNEHTSERLRLAQNRTEKDEQLQEVLVKLLEAEDGRKQNEKDVRLKATISDLKRIFPGVKGRVSELCKPIEKRFGIAVSTILGRNFDAVIVENEKTAIDCIQYLREQRRGQATFIPLDTIQWTAINSNLKGIHRGSRMAMDCISYDSSLERAVSYVCGNAIVCDDLATAKNICWDKRNDVKAVTLDGSIIHKGGNMTGGQGGKGDARRWEDVEVENLRKLKDKLVAELAALPESRRGASEEEVLQGELIGLEQKLSYAKEEQKAIGRNLTSKGKELAHAQEELASVNPKYQGKHRELQELEARLKELQTAVGEVEDEVFAAFCQRLHYDNIRVYEAQQGSLQQEGAQKRLEFATQKSRLESRMSYVEKHHQEIKNRIKVLEDRAKQDQDLITELEAEQQATQNELDVLGAELEQLSEELERHRAEYARRSEKVAEHRREVQKRSKTVDSTLKAIATLDSERQLNAASRYTLLRRCKLENINLPLEEESAGLDQLPIDIVQADPDAMDVDEDPDSSVIHPAVIQDYGIIIDFDDLDEDLREVSRHLLPDTANPPTRNTLVTNAFTQSNDEKLDEDLQEKVKALNNELDHMAPNMRAIERLEVVQDRLKSTEKDFEHARRLAKRAKDDFEEVKEQRFELFNKAFSHISEQIGPIYRELTRSDRLPMGGQA